MRTPVPECHLRAFPHFGELFGKVFQLANLTESPLFFVSSDSMTYPAADWGPRGIHAITMYQTFSLAITGHEDRCIRFYDLNRQGGEANQSCVATIVTHLDAVTCLTVDPHDLYVLTGSKFRTRHYSFHSFMPVFSREKFDWF